MINILRKLLGKGSKLKAVNMNDYHLTKDGTIYVIFCEKLVGNPSRVLYRDNVYELDKPNIKLSSDLVNEILLEVKKELEYQGVTVEIFPA